MNSNSWARTPWDKDDYDALKRHAFLQHPAECVLQHIEYFEGFKATAYKCPLGVWTIGYGHTEGVKEGDGPITHHEAEAMLLADVKKFIAQLAPYVNAPLSGFQFVAIVSLAYNIGVKNLTTKCPKLMRALNCKHYEEAAKEFLDITNGGLPGLVKRREAEAELMRLYRE